MAALTFELGRPFRKGQVVVRVPDPTGEAVPGEGVWVKDSTGTCHAGEVIEVAFTQVEVARPGLLRFLPSNIEMKRSAKVRLLRAAS
jgi:hypothetical protein